MRPSYAAAPSPFETALVYIIPHIMVVIFELKGNVRLLKEKMTTNYEAASVTLTGSMEKEKWLSQDDGFNLSVGGTECVIPGRDLSAALV
ncbi:UNVERIFIED_CONTAM: hypothetical protein FKN15_060673 [Acipenser sinensis]